MVYNSLDAIKIAISSEVGTRIDKGNPGGYPIKYGAKAFVLLSTACPTSLASDQTKGGGRPGVQRTPRFGAREQRFDLTKIQLSSKLSPKDPKEFAKKFRDATGEPREKRLLQITNLKATLQRLHRLYIYHTEKRSGRATPEIFLFFVCPLRGQFHSRRESSRRTSRLEGFC